MVVSSAGGTVISFLCHFNLLMPFCPWLCVKIADCWWILGVTGSLKDVSLGYWDQKTFGTKECYYSSWPLTGCWTALDDQCVNTVVRRAVWVVSPFIQTCSLIPATLKWMCTFNIHRSHWMHIPCFVGWIPVLLCAWRKMHLKVIFLSELQNVSLSLLA